ncbi:hypothetical protein AGMMS49944_23370 [Spirochaetia bacterium]|nr:hypothetical protein AGMMS49944_23370 [Spirochaetia bacterium]
MKSLRTWGNISPTPPALRPKGRGIIPLEIKKLQLLKINYLVTGAVNDADDYYSIVIDILDVSNGKFVNSDNELVPGRQPDLNKGVSALVTRFLSGMTSQGGTVAQKGNVRDSYRIGDTGPAGGLIFYDKGNNSDGWRYLEAAPQDLGQAEWAGHENENIGIVVSGTGTETGRGKRNTQLIVDAFKRRAYTGRAAQLCASFNYGCYTDWFLPSKDELDLMYKNLAIKGVGGFTGGWYWSSSEYSNSFAWVQVFSDGNQHTGSKSNRPSYVRAVRAF